MKILQISNLRYKLCAFFYMYWLLNSAKSSQPGQDGAVCEGTVSVFHSHLLAAVRAYLGHLKLPLLHHGVPRGEVNLSDKEKHSLNFWEFPSTHPVITHQREDFIQRKCNSFVFKHSFTVWQCGDPTERYQNSNVFFYKHFSSCPSCQHKAAKDHFRFH